MMSDSAGTQDAVEAVEAGAEQANEATKAGVQDAAVALDHATAAVADGAQSLSQDGAEAAASAARAGGDAIDEARARLDAMASALPKPAQDLLRPFGAGQDAFGKGLGAGYATAMEGMAEFNSKAIAAWRSNAESTIRHWQGLANVGSLSEAIALSAEHTRKQLEAVTVQTRELSALATRIVRDAADPMKLTGR